MRSKINKKITAIMLIFTMVLSYFAVIAKNVDAATIEGDIDDGKVHYSVNGDTITFTVNGGYGYGATVTNEWTSDTNINVANIKKVVIDTNCSSSSHPLVSIKSTTFYNNLNIEQLEITGSNKIYIDTDAFYGCDNLTTANLSAVSQIGERAFFSCDNLTNVTLGSSVRTIEDSAFNLAGLTEITLPEGLLEIKSKAFSNTQIQNIELPASLTTLSNDFCSTTTGNIKSITVKDGNEYFASDENGVLYNKDKTILKLYPSGKTEEEYTIPTTVTQIDDFAFNSTHNLNRINFNNTITKIGNYAFESCRGVENIDLPASVREIGEHAFENCSNLASIGLPEGLTTVGKFAFKGTAITSITFPSTLQVADAIFDDGDIVSTSNNTTLTTATFANGTTKICDGILKGCTKLVTINIPNSVVEIGQGSFQKCRLITNLNILGNITTIGEAAYMYCNGITAVTLPDSITEIKDNTFCGCESLTDVTLPSKITRIGSNAFCDCAFSEINIPETVTEIKALAFQNCSNLQEMVIPIGVNTIGYETFVRCTRLEKVVIPDTVTSIDSHAFDNCSSDLNIYCKTGSTADTTYTSYKPHKVLDDTAPTIAGAEIQGAYITVNGATDEGAGLAKSAYSLDGTNWYRSNQLAYEGAPTTSGTDGKTVYTVYVRDAIGNYATSEVEAVGGETPSPSVTETEEPTPTTSTTTAPTTGTPTTSTTTAPTTGTPTTSITTAPTTGTPSTSITTAPTTGTPTTSITTAPTTGTPTTTITTAPTTGTPTTSITTAPTTGTPTTTITTAPTTGIPTTTITTAPTTGTPTTTITTAPTTGTPSTTDPTETPVVTPKTIYVDGVEVQAEPTAKNILLVSETDGTKEYITVAITDENVKYKKGSKSTLTFRVPGNNFEKFYGIKIDGIQVDKKYYTYKKGSTIITLSNQYLEGLDNKTHYITALYDGGRTETDPINFTVESKTSQDPTNDPTNDPKVTKTTETSGNGPSVSEVKVDGNKITVVTDVPASELADKPYSLDGVYWQTSNVFNVENSGKYVVYVKDKNGNITKKNFEVGGVQNQIVNINQGKDNSSAKSVIPNTGASQVLIFIVIAGVIVAFRMINKYKNIKTK